MKQVKKIGNDKKDRSVIEASLEGAEVIADLVIHEDVLSDIPFIGMAFKICKAADTIRDKAFAEKLARFLIGLNLASDEDKERIKKKMCNSTEEARKVGENLFLIIEKFTDLDKPTLLAKIFASYLDEVISSAELRRLAQSIDLAFIDDIVSFLESGEIEEGVEQEWMAGLIAAGFTCLTPPMTIDAIGNLSYQITELGYLLKKAYLHGAKLV